MRKQIATLQRIEGELERVVKELGKLKPRPDHTIALIILQGVHKIKDAGYLLEKEALT